MAQGGNLTLAGKLVVLAVVAASFYGAYRMFFAGRPAAEQRSAAVNSSSSGGDSSAGQPASGTPNFETSSIQPCEIGVAYGTEKKRWLEWAKSEFQKTAAGQKIKVNLLPMGSLEGGQAVLKGDKNIHVWSPASSLYKDVFVQEWKLNQTGEPVIREDELALSPMVFVMWDERYQAFAKKYQEVGFRNVGLALAEPGGWKSIAEKPEWGLFKFGHAHPNQSNSGLMTLVLMACEFHNKNRGLTLNEIVDVPFQQWMQTVERGVSGLSNSTGNMMKDMVLRGPSSFDCLFVYENVAIDYFKNAEGRWGQLRIVYPTKNMWNDNPYYVLNVPWSSPAQRQAAGLFLDFLLSEPVQTQALVHGFRPGNPAIPINGPDSPFTTYQKYGLQVELSSICDPPSAEVIHNLLASWQRSVGNR